MLNNRKSFSEGVLIWLIIKFALMIPKKFYNILIAIGVFFCSFLFVRIISFTSFPDKIFPKINTVFSKSLYSLSEKFPFSVGDFFYILLMLGCLSYLLYVFRIIRSKNWEILRKTLTRLVYFMVFFFWIFQLIWGFNYYKKPIAENYNTENITVDELKLLAEMYFMRSVFLREQVGEDENGVFKFQLTQNEINLNLQRSASEIKLKYPEIHFIAPTLPNIKSSLFSKMFSYLGVSGYYIPFTAESQYNAKMPDTKLLFTQFHETAHQWGFAPENEANFVGYLLGKESGDVEMNYASNYRAMRSILNRILLVDPVYVQVMLFRYSDGMKRDRSYEREINEKYSGKGDEAFSLMNETFLKLNNQEGLESYGRFVELLVGFNRKYSKLE